MKTLLLFIALLTSTFTFSQSLPIDFEADVTTSNFIDFDGGIASVIANPQLSGINTSPTVAQIIRDGGQPWGGSKIELTNNLDFSTLNSITMKVYSTAPIGTVIKFKLESSSNSTERDMTTTTTNEWETLTWDFTGTPPDLKSIVFMFDFGNVGDGSVNSTYLFDDIQQTFGGEQIDFPVDFESMTTNYMMTDFGGNVSSLIIDPEDDTNHVIQAIKTDQAATWAGTTIGTPAGFATNIPFQLTNSKMNIRVWSPEAGTPIRLKVEDSSDPTHTCETETQTTTAQQWETLVFDFNNQATGTESLSVGLSMGWTYNMASIFFNFGTEGSAAGEKTYYFDDVKFGDLISSVDLVNFTKVNVYPNPTSDTWNIESNTAEISSLELIDLQGQVVFKSYSNQNNQSIEASSFPNGVYFLRITSNSESLIKRIIKR
ncbi:MAG: hypothetical protein ACI86M_001875 [Saprospiraceae bacterium]|jgi:hypothetical protein